MMRALQYKNPEILHANLTLIAKFTMNSPKIMYGEMVFQQE